MSSKRLLMVAAKVSGGRVAAESDLIKIYGDAAKRLKKAEKDINKILGEVSHKVIAVIEPHVESTQMVGQALEYIEEAYSLINKGAKQLGMQAFNFEGFSKIERK